MTTPAPDPLCPVRVGQAVPDLPVLDAYDPAVGDFKKFDFAKQKAASRWTVLFFYPADWTFVCATEFAALAEQNERFKRLGADVVAISRDTHFVHLSWQAHEKELALVKFLMASDVKGEVARLFGVYDEDTGLALRGTFIVNPKGVLTASDVSYYNVGRNIDELMRRFKANLYLSKKPLEVCPSKWKDDGDATLVNPGARIVGKVHEALGGA
jgi:peroxiredoxin (alkyl hydroperoxide reductase subunit C)